MTFFRSKYPGGLFLKCGCSPCLWLAIRQLTQIAMCPADFRDGGGYYIDVGCSRLIADGKVKIKQGVEIEKLTKDGVLFKDGVELKADISTLRSFAGLRFHLC